MVDAVNLQHVDVRSQTTDAVLDGIKNVLPGETRTIDHLAIINKGRLQRQQGFAG